MNAAPSPALHALDLVKTYGDKRALDGFTLTVAPGTIHGLLGPNGAGKSTAVGILTTLTSHDGGTARVSGINVSDGTSVRQRIGLVGQDAAVDEILSGHQNLVMFARLLGLSRKDAARRATELLKQFSLTEAADRPASGYSGGMRRRLDIAVSLIRNPQRPVPRRAHHRPRPAGTPGCLGRDHPRRVRGNHRPADHPVP